MNNAERESSRKRTSKYREANREKTRLAVRKCHLKRAYDMTIEEFTEMLNAQEGLCAICSIELVLGERSSDRTACVDHDHTTGEIRGILCGNCNRGLGMFKDNEDICLKAGQYLSSWRI